MIQEAKKGLRVYEAAGRRYGRSHCSLSCITHQKEQLKINPRKIDIRHLPPPEKDLPR